MAVTAKDLEKAGWHKVNRRSGTKYLPCWCHGGRKGSYTFHEAVKIYKETTKATVQEGNHG